MVFVSFGYVKTFIFINIPAYQLRYFENGKLALESKVVVGKVMNQTVVLVPI